MAATADRAAAAPDAIGAMDRHLAEMERMAATADRAAAVFHVRFVPPI
jgi:hypothetical protein